MRRGRYSASTNLRQVVDRRKCNWYFLVFCTYRLCIRRLHQTYHFPILLFLIPNQPEMKHTCPQACRGIKRRLLRIRFCECQEQRKCALHRYALSNKTLPTDNRGYDHFYVVAMRKSKKNQMKSGGERGFADEA